MNSDDKKALAALAVQVIGRRYPRQPMEAGEKEDWLRSAIEGDPVVLLEAAWEWWGQHAEGKFRPSPGQLLREVADKWCPDRKPYLPLRVAVKRFRDGEVTDGLRILIKRMGEGVFREAVDGAITPSLERAWEQANHQHRVWAFAKDRMVRRDTPSWNPSEAKGIGLSSGGHLRDALCVPAARGDVPRLGAGEDLAGRKRITKEGL